MKPSSDTESQTPAAGMNQETSSNKEKRKTASELEDKEKEKIEKLMEKVNAALTQSEENRERGRKRQILIFYYRKGKRVCENQPKNDEEELESSSATSNVQGLPEAEDI